MQSSTTPAFRRSLATSHVAVAAAVAVSVLATSCQSLDGPPPPPPVPGALLKNDLIEKGERRYFKNLWQVTFGGQNAEAYWSFSGDRLSLQITDPTQGFECDRIFVTGSDSMQQISNGVGVTTCAFFMPDDERVLYASTHSGQNGCPSKPQTEGYVWMVWPDYDIYVTDLDTLDEQPLVVEPNSYDAEATVSPRGDRIVFTSTRSGDLELWTCDLEGGDVRQITDTLGYDGGAFFNHAGDRLVYRATEWTEGSEAEEQATYQELLRQWQVRPQAMEIYTIGAGGGDRFQVTHLGGANFAPYFHPDDERIIFSSNHAGVGSPVRKDLFNFDLYSVRTDGTDLQRITFFDGPAGKQFDAFPMFSPDGRFLAFSSNRGDGKPGDTNVFVAEWRD